MLRFAPRTDLTYVCDRGFQTSLVYTLGSPMGSVHEEAYDSCAGSAYLHLAIQGW